MKSLVNFVEKDNQLVITLTDEGKEELENLKNLPIMDALAELFEDYMCNGWVWVSPEEIGALTDAPIISNDYTYIDDEANYYHSVYWFPDYMIKNELKELENVKLIFIKTTN